NPVFGASDDPVRGAVVSALESAHTRARQQRSEIRILARAFRDSAPARVARNINHRRESPVNAGRPRFRCGYARGAFYCRRVPTRGFTKRYWKDGAITVNDIEAKDEWNLQTRFGDRDSLKLVGFLRAAHV